MKNNALKNFFILETIEDDSSEFNYSSQWYQDIENRNSQQYFHDFRMSKECFEKLKSYILNIQYIEKIQLKLHMILHYLGHDISIRGISNLFGISKSTVMDHINEILEILTKTAHLYIEFPSENEYEFLNQCFGRSGRSTGAILSIDGTHFNITKPGRNTFDFYNRKGVFSINFICVVDANKLFRGITYGFGKSHDAGIYRDSELRNLIENIQGEYFVVGDPAFIGFDKIFSAYDNNIRPNLLRVIKTQRVVVENAFALLKNKFKKLSRRTLVYKIDKFIKIIKSAMFLHNFIIKNDE